MKNTCYLTGCVALAGACMLTHGVAAAAGDAGGLQYELSIEELEFTGSHDDLAWDIDARAGFDAERLVLKSAGAHGNQVLDTHELQVLYSHTLAGELGLLAGWRGDVHPEPHRHWLALGVEGMTIASISTEIMASLDAHGRSNFTITAESAWPLSRSLQLEPEIEMVLNGKDDPATANGHGLAQISAGLRLHYRLTPRLAPYIGTGWSRYYGRSADFAQAEGVQESQTRFLLGIHADL